MTAAGLRRDLLEQAAADSQAWLTEWAGHRFIPADTKEAAAVLARCLWSL